MPRPDRFWDKVAARYGAKPIKDTASYERTLDGTRKVLREGDQALEIGCGTGSTALRLAPSVQRYVARDFSARMIEIAREKARSEGVDNLCFEVGTLEDEALESGPFDVVLAFNLLHLLDDIPAALRRAHALLKPDGHLVTKTICLAEQTRLWKLPLAAAHFVGLAPSVRCMTIAQLEGMIRDAGFEIVETGNYPPSPPNHFVVARRR